MILDNSYKKHITVLLSLLAIILFSAFGCKQSEDKPADEGSTTDQQPKVTYEVPSDTTQNNFTDQGTQTQQDGAQDSADNQNQGTTQDQQGTTQDTNNGTDTQTQNGSTDSQKQPSEDESVVLSQTEKIVEIYGTFTNKGSEPYKNLKDLEVYATPNMLGWVQSQTQKPLDQNAPFFGMTTKALSSVALESSANNAKILVTTKREEIVESRQQPRVFYALIEVVMVKEGDLWKVDGLYWQD